MPAYYILKSVSHSTIPSRNSMDESSRLASLAINSQPDNLKLAKKHSKEIDALIKLDHQTKRSLESGQMKILLLGSGDSGISNLT